MTKQRFFAGLFALLGLFLPFIACNSQDNKDLVEEIDPEAGRPKPTFPVQLFHYSDVELLDGPFETALEINYTNLMKYNVDSLLFPYRRTAGLPTRANGYLNWGGTDKWTLDGHIAGHHLSALSMTYAASSDPAIKDAVDARIEYMLDELQACQTANGDGYVGAVVKTVWNQIKAKTVSSDGGFDLNGYWVPWYNVHKMYAGLRDAYIYAGKERAATMFLEFCDWGIGVINNLNDTQMETMLNTEFGGMNEVYADAYILTGDEKYINAAKRFSHARWLNSLASATGPFHTHANTLIPKVVGYAKVTHATNEQNFFTAANFFWQEIVDKYSVSFGGNSLNEWLFPAYNPNDANDLFNDNFFEEETGPETCNSNNMLRLTETLFQIGPSAKHADYYERVMYNHILSSQNPTTGGYVYFTPLKLEHYRVYSQIDQLNNSDMWCCVGTGMENHARYGAFIYAHNNDELYVNLFAASKVTWREKGVTLTQNTHFPDTETSELVVNVSTPTRFKLRIRYPWWIGDEGMQVTINNGRQNYAVGGERSSYMEIDRTWQNGDKVNITMPMNIYIEKIYQVDNYIAIMRGPILLAAKTETEANLRMRGLGDRWGHIADSMRNSTTVLQGTAEEALAKIKNMTAQEDGGFLVINLTNKGSGDTYLIPFYTLHDSRYMMYWYLATP